MQRKHPVCYWDGGQLITGLFVVDEGTVIVSSGRHQRATQLGGSEPDIVARWLLRDMSQDRGES